LSKITITPIGTCRISTPLKRGATRFPILLDYQRVYGFVHTTTEVIQQLRFRSGELTFPAEVLPILFRPGVSCDDHIPEKAADLTIVEISSSKAYMLGDVAIQCNYLHQYFADFFASRSRVRTYLDLTSHGDRDALQAFLDKDPVYKLYKAEDRAILSGLTTRVQTFDEVSADMATIAETIGKESLLFVSHVNVTTPDGSLIASRDKLIRWVKLASSQLGVACFDPTPLMTDFGQDRAMEGGGLDSTHYTNAFSDCWFANMQRDHIFARAGAGVEAGEAAGADGSVLSESIAATLNHYDFFDGSRQLFAALKAHPEDVALRMLHGQVLARIGDYEGASNLLAPHMGVAEMSHEMRQAVMRVLIETGDAQGALDLASQMLGDEYESAEIYEIAGRAADQLSRPEEAVRYRKLAFRRDPSIRDTAIPVLDHYKVSGESELYDAWLAEVVEVLENRGDAALASGLAEWAISRQEEYALGRALAVIAQKDPGLLPALIEEASRVGMYSALTILAGLLAGMPDLAEKAARPLRGLAQTWAETAQELLGQGRVRDAHVFASACLAVHPTHSIARSVRRAVVDALWTDVQAARGERALVDLCDEAGDIIYDRRSIGLLYSRALAKVDRVADAERVARNMHAAAPDDVDVSANYAMLAAQNGNFRTALHLYGGLSELSSDSTERYQNRINAFISTAGPKGVRYLRSLLAESRFDDAVATYRLLEHYASLPQQQFESEGARILSAMRVHLRQLDEEEAGSREVLDILALMLSLAPAEPRLLRRAGIEYMKVEEFERAMDFWRRLEAVSPDLQSAANNIQRCEILAARQARKSRSRPVAVSLAA
jgi:tetratricopeptide (TPR) repeat protein